MVVQQKDQESLQQRVNEFLRGHSTAYVVEEVGEEAVEDIFIMVQKAEEDLRAAQERLDRLKWELAKAKEKR